MTQLSAPQSHLQIFKKLIKLRKEPSMQDGELQIKAIPDDIIIYSRQKAGSDMYVIVLNLSRNDQTININSHYDMGSKAEIITTSVQSKNSDG